MPADLAELLSEVRRPDIGNVPLGTARWMGLDEATADLRFRTEAPSPQVWIGQAFDAAATGLGYADDRHVCLVSGTRGGKGAGIIIPNLCLWPGSCVVVDPKGENATVTARRRANGSEYARGLEQKVCILDPYNEVDLEPSLKGRYNPLDIIDIEGDLAVADAGRIAAAIVVRENKNDPYWEEAARNLVEGLILHVLTWWSFEGIRNLVTVRRLLTQGDWLGVQLMREAGETDIPSAFNILWATVRRNAAFNGVIAGVGEQMIAMADKQRSGVLESARTNTKFLDDAPMQRLVETSDFELAELKTNPTGLSLYLTLPQRFMETHFRWLRLMISLAIGEMERVKGRPRSGYPTLFVLDEFAGLKRMEVVEHAVAQAAGFGVKFLFITQNLTQLKTVYDDGWETFVSNCGLKLFFQVDDDFTRSYVSRLLGEYEVRRETRSSSHAESRSRSRTKGENFSKNIGTSTGSTDGGSSGYSRNYGSLFTLFLTGRGRQYGSSWSQSSTSTKGFARGTSTSVGDTYGDSTTTGWGEAVHKRSLLNADEIGRFLSRIDNPHHPAYPGLIVAIMPGRDPLLVRRINYFEAPLFAGRFDPHPNYPPPPTLAELAASAQQPKQIEFRSITAEFLNAATALYDNMGRTIRKTVSFAINLVAFAVVTIVVIGVVGQILDPERTVPSKKETPAAGRSSPASAEAAPRVPSPTQATVVPPSNPVRPRSREGKIFPFAVKAWVAPAVGANDPSVGLFKYGVQVEILDRVAGPYGWDWLKVKGVTDSGQTVEAYVRSDLVAGTDIKPQPGMRCARDNLTETFGRTPVYDPAVIEAMTGLEETFPRLEFLRLAPGTIFTAGPSVRGANGWEWHKVSLRDGRTGVIRADQLRVGQATFENGSWKCEVKS